MRYFLINWCLLALFIWAVVTACNALLGAVL